MLILNMTKKRRKNFLIILKKHNLTIIIMKHETNSFKKIALKNY